MGFLLHNGWWLTNHDTGWHDKKDGVYLALSAAATAGER
jgi:hypothetical protein